MLLKNDGILPLKNVKKVALIRPNAVQIVYYRNRKREVFKHVGSAKSSQELESLKLVAQDVINVSST